MKIFLLLFALLPFTAVAAEYYQCKDEKGRPVFSQTPCADGAQKQYVNEPASNGPEARKRRALEQRKDELRRKLIPAQYTKLEALRTERDEKIIALRQEHAGPQAIEQLTAEYDAYLAKERETLAKYKAEFEAIETP